MASVRAESNAVSGNAARFSLHPDIQLAETFSATTLSYLISATLVQIPRRWTCHPVFAEAQGSFFLHFTAQNTPCKHGCVPLSGGVRVGVIAGFSWAQRAGICRRHGSVPLACVRIHRACPCAECRWWVPVRSQAHSRSSLTGNMPVAGRPDKDYAPWVVPVTQGAPCCC